MLADILVSDLKKKKNQPKKLSKEHNTLLHKDKDLSMIWLFCKSVPDEGSMREKGCMYP